MKLPSRASRKFDWKFPIRLWRLRRRIGTSWEGKLALILTIIGLGAAIATYAALNSMPPFGNSSDVVIWLLNLDLIILLTLVILVARRVVALFSLWRRGMPGSQIHMKFVYIFGLFAIAPVVIMTIFSLFFFHYGVQAWFSDRVKTAVQESKVVAESYLREHQQVIRADILAMANDLNRESSHFYTNPQGFERFVQTQSILRNLPEVALLTSERKFALQTGLPSGFDRRDIPEFAIDRANQGEVVILTDVEDDKVRAIMKLQNLSDIYLFVGRPVEANVLNHLAATREAVQRYDEVADRYVGLRLTVTLIYVVVALFLLVAAIWFGLTFARRLAFPISDLIQVSNRIRDGDLHVKASTKSGLEEFDSLGRSFNRMTEEIQSQREELVSANKQMDQRRRFTETVLAGVTSGILSVDRLGLIRLANSAAGEILRYPAERLIGESVFAILPEAKEILDQSYDRPNKAHNFEAPYISENGSKRILLIRVAIELIGDEDQGAVITFDDITDLQSAQRKAAWSDVARRIAHEIKNPLTPIQLSAERLKRKYLKTLPDTDQTIFSQCIDTIVRHVGDIGHMVNEFSSFARMPEAVITENNISRMIAEMTTLQQSATETKIHFRNDLTDAKIYCDAQQMRQAFTNILKNALDSIEEKQKDDLSFDKAMVAVWLKDMDHNKISISVLDNGLGLPANRDHDSLTEPYVTLKEKGTGLGLAIVKKIMEDHGGSIVFGNADSKPKPDEWQELNGACVTLVLPRKQDQAHEIDDAIDDQIDQDSI